MHDTDQPELELALDRIERIVRNLTRPIPEPPRRPIKDTKSFAGLRVGQRIRIKEGLGKGLTFVVLATDSEGATIQDADYPEAPAVRLTDRDWKSAYKRVPVRQPKPPKEST